MRRARGRSRSLQRWCPRLRLVVSETGEKASGQPRGRISWASMPCNGACWRPEGPIEQYDDDARPGRADSDSGRGGRSRIHVGRARRRSRRPQGWCPRLPPRTIETGEKPSDRSRGRVSWTSVPCPGACWRPDAPDRTNLCSMMTPTTAQADHY